MSDESEQDRREFGLDLGEVRFEPAAGRARLRWYVAAITLFPFALIAFSLYWMTTGEYMRHSRSLYLSQIGYGAKLVNANCEVVIDGDSTAMVDILPRLITEQTGLTACNIAEVAGVKRINGMAVLDTYLRRNRRPKYLLFQFAPENLSDPARWEWGGTFEGFLYGSQFGHEGDVLRSLRKDIDSGLSNAELGFRSGVVWHLSRAIRPEQAHTRDEQMGRMPEEGDNMAGCYAGDDRRLAPQPAWLSGLRSTYGQGGTRVLIDVVPLPVCDATLDFYRGTIQPGVLDNAVSTLPVGLYIGTGRLHMNDAGAHVLTERIIAQLQQAETGGR